VGGAKKEYEAAIEGLKWTSRDALEWAGAPNGEDLAVLEEAGRNLAKAIKEG
jgi:hypothetical protein